MAPADRRGYKLLPTEDVSANAGGQEAPWPPPPKPSRKVAKPSGEGAERRPAGGAAGKDSEKATRGKSAASEGLDDGGDGLFGKEENKSKESSHIKYDGALRFDLSADPCVIHPYHPVVQGWNAVLTTLLAFDVGYIPVEVAFAKYLPKDAVWIFNVVSSVLFGFDIILQFFLQIPSPSGAFWIFSHRKIVVAYLKGWCLIDVISVFPFSEVHELMGGSSAHRYLFHLLRFVKLLRMVRIGRLINRYQYHFGITLVTRAIILSVSTILVSLHVMSCIWATLGNYQDGYDWLKELRHTKELEGHHIPFYESLGTDEEDPCAAYIASTYFALYTLTGIGYGDIVPTTKAEYLLVIVMMLCGSMIWATIIGNIVNVIRSSNVAEVHFAETIDSLMEMSKEYEIEQTLKHSIRNYLEQSRVTQQTNFVQEQVISRMTSMLAVSCVRSLHEGWMQKIWWMKTIIPMPCIVSVAVAFNPTLFCPQEFIRTGDKMFIVERGLCLHGTKVCGRNQVWGEDLLLQQHHLRKNLTTVAISYLHTLNITRGDLMASLEHFSEGKVIVRRAFVKLAVIRGVIYKASQMKAQQKKLEADANLIGIDYVEVKERRLKSMESADRSPASAPAAASESLEVTGAAQAAEPQDELPEVTRKLSTRNMSGLPISFKKVKGLATNNLTDVAKAAHNAAVSLEKNLERGVKDSVGSIVEQGRRLQGAITAGIDRPTMDDSPLEAATAVRLQDRMEKLEKGMTARMDKIERNVEGAVSLLSQVLQQMQTKRQLAARRLQMQRAVEEQEAALREDAASAPLLDLDAAGPNPPSSAA